MKLLSFIRTLRAIIIFFHPNQKKPPRSLPLNLYRHCSELPLDNFIACVVDKTYKVLIKYGHASPYDLSRLWDNIYSEFSEMSGSPAFKLIMSLSKDIGFLESKLLNITLCMGTMPRLADARMIKILKNYGFNYAFNINDPKQYRLDLDAVFIRSRAIKLALEQKRNEYNSAIKGMGSREVTREDFSVIIASLSKYMGFRIDPRQTTVSEYVSYRKLYEHETESNLRNKK